MQKVIIYFTPSELAAVRGISLSSLFETIRQKQIPYVITEGGTKIPVTYYIDNDS